MTQQQQDDVYAGKLDFRKGRGWVTPDGTGTSMGDMDIKYPRKINSGNLADTMSRDGNKS